nr:MAG TPA: hypothetical protein [Caudoviricetes sp.]
MSTITLYHYQTALCFHNSALFTGCFFTSPISSGIAKTYHVLGRPTPFQKFSNTVLGQQG